MEPELTSGTIATTILVPIAIVAVLAFGLYAYLNWRKLRAQDDAHDHDSASPERDQ